MSIDTIRILRKSVGVLVRVGVLMFQIEEEISVNEDKRNPVLSTQEATFIASRHPREKQPSQFSFSDTLNVSEVKRAITGYLCPVYQWN